METASALSLADNARINLGLISDALPDLLDNRTQFQHLLTQIRPGTQIPNDLIMLLMQGAKELFKVPSLNHVPPAQVNLQTATLVGLLERHQRFTTEHDMGHLEGANLLKFIHLLPRYRTLNESQYCLLSLLVENAPQLYMIQSAPYESVLEQQGPTQKHDKKITDLQRDIVFPLSLLMSTQYSRRDSIVGIRMNGQEVVPTTCNSIIDINCPEGLQTQYFGTLGVSLLNILQNAFIHGTSDDPIKDFHIHIDVSQKGDNLTIDVLDNGSGISLDTGLLSLIEIVRGHRQKDIHKQEIGILLNYLSIIDPDTLIIVLDWLNGSHFSLRELQVGTLTDSATLLSRLKQLVNEHPLSHGIGLMGSLLSLRKISGNIQSTNQAAGGAGFRIILPQ